MKHSEYFNGAFFLRVAGISSLVPLALTFCGCLSRPPLNKQTFAFNVPAAATNAASENRVLGIRSLQVAPPFDGRPLVYRTGEFSYERDPYATFLDSPGAGLATPIRELLRGDGGFRTVTEAGSAAVPDTLVEIHIQQLYGDIRNPASPCAVLALRVTFLEAIDGLPGKIMLDQNYSRRIPMKSTTAAALMEGWNQALAGIFAEVTLDFRRQATGNPEP